MSNSIYQVHQRKLSSISMAHKIYADMDEETKHIVKGKHLKALKEAENEFAEDFRLDYLTEDEFLKLCDDSLRYKEGIDRKFY